MPEPSQSFLTTAYAGLRAAVGVVGPDDSWAGTGCLGWSVRDLTFHCWTDAERALVAVHTPAAQEPDLDAVTYWQDWGSDRDRVSGGDAAAAGRRWVRVSASLFLDWDQLRAEYLATSLAVERACADAESGLVVATQGHALELPGPGEHPGGRGDDHHLDLVAHLRGVPGPSDRALAATRRVVDGVADAVAGASFPRGWDDRRCILVATGRAQPGAEESDDSAPFTPRSRSSAEPAVRRAARCCDGPPADPASSGRGPRRSRAGVSVTALGRRPPPAGASGSSRFARPITRVVVPARARGPGSRSRRAG